MKPPPHSILEAPLLVEKWRNGGEDPTPT